MKNALEDRKVRHKSKEIKSLNLVQFRKAKILWRKMRKKMRKLK